VTRAREINWKRAVEARMGVLVAGECWEARGKMPINKFKTVGLAGSLRIWLKSGGGGTNNGVGNAEVELHKYDWSSHGNQENFGQVEGGGEETQNSKDEGPASGVICTGVGWARGKKRRLRETGIRQTGGGGRVTRYKGMDKDVVRLT